MAYLVFNTINNLTTQDEQVACFVNAAEHLEAGGSFVIEVGVPALRLLPPGQRAVPFDVGEKHWAYDLYDCATQSMSSNYVDEEDGVARLWSVPFRYVWPAELDLMARIAGLRPRSTAGRTGTARRSTTRAPATSRCGGRTPRRLPRRSPRANSRTS